MSGAARAIVDALVFSNLWLAGAAAALVAAASRAMAIEPATTAIGLAAFGTLVVYNVDRLRDLARDRETAPERSRFVEERFDSLAGLVVLASVACAALGLVAGWRVALALAPALALGLLHRRLKGFAPAKSAYVTGSWLCVVVGLPVVVDPAARQMGWTAAILGLALAANAIASNVRDHEAGAAALGVDRALAVARALAIAGVVLAVFAPAPTDSLLWVPLATAIVLVAFRSTERYGLVAVDGALLVGALASLAAG